MKVLNMFRQWMLPSIVATALILPVYAVDGVVLISQAGALAGNVTPGDTAGFPVTISVPGSYRLSSNLTINDANMNVIEITADNVTLDLNGFLIIGPTTCTGPFGGPVTSCSPLATGFGLGFGVLSGNSNITVLNGNIHGMGTAGIELDGPGCRVERVDASGNGLAGFELRDTDGTVTSSSANRNGSTGINAPVVTGSTARENGSGGILSHSLAVNNFAISNGQAGIDGFGTIIGNTAVGNGTQGIKALCPSTVVSNTATGNPGGDIFTSGSGCTRANNTPAP